LFKTIASDRRDDAKLGKMGTDRVDHCGLLANKQMAQTDRPRISPIKSAFFA
jgi:hypothetical protein